VARTSLAPDQLPNSGEPALRGDLDTGSSAAPSCPQSPSC
jgi:hypothetical protein